MNVFILNDGCVREDAITQNLKARLKKENHSITTDYKNADILIVQVQVIVSMKV